MLCTIHPFCSLFIPCGAPAGSQIQGAGPAAGSSGGGSSSGSAMASASVGRLEDEVHITLTKALSHSTPGYKRIGIVGSLAIMRQMAVAYPKAEQQGDADATGELFLSCQGRAGKGSMQPLHQGTLPTTPRWRTRHGLLA